MTNPDLGVLKAAGYSNIEFQFSNFRFLVSKKSKMVLCHFKNIDFLRFWAIPRGGPNVAQGSPRDGLRRLNGAPGELKEPGKAQELPQEE